MQWRHSTTTETQRTLRARFKSDGASGDYPRQVTAPRWPARALSEEVRVAGSFTIVVATFEKKKEAQLGAAASMESGNENTNFVCPPGARPSPASTDAETTRLVTGAFRQVPIRRVGLLLTMSRIPPPKFIASRLPMVRIRTTRICGLYIVRLTIASLSTRSQIRRYRREHR